MQAQHFSEVDHLASFETLSQALHRMMRGLTGVGIDRQTALLSLICLVGGGHGLFTHDDGQTPLKLLSALAQLTGLPHRHLVGSLDLLPEDLIGHETLSRQIDAPGAIFQAGPIFSPLLYVEAIDRAPPKLQSILIETLSEAAVRCDGVLRPLPRPYHVFVSEHPGDRAPRHPLSEAQLDRFSVSLPLDVGTIDLERYRLLASGRPLRTVSQLKPQMSAEDLVAAQRLSVELPVGEQVVELILKLVRIARPEDQDAPKAVKTSVRQGPGPRAGQALMRAIRAKALIEGRPAPSVEDVRDLAPFVLYHRLSLSDPHQWDRVLSDLIAQL